MTAESRPMSPDPYLSSEDSGLLRRAIEERSGESALEIGAGNGGNLVHLSKRFTLVVGTDLTLPSMTDWKDSGANFVLADGASCIRRGAFDLVAFNPPYLREEVVDSATDGGKELEVPQKFLEDALRVVKEEGEVVFILNDEARLGEFQMTCAARGFSVRPIMSRRMFFEELTALSAKVSLDAPIGEDPSGMTHGGTSTARRLHHVPASPS